MSTTAPDQESAEPAATSRPARPRPGTPFADDPAHAIRPSVADDYPDEEPAATPRRRLDRALIPSGPVATFVAMYLLAVAVMLVGIESHPAFLYNWESYTVRGAIDFLRDPNGDVFELRDGLMTDSGRIWPTVLPIWLGMKIGGVDLTAVRVPIVLISALSVPLTWLFGRRVATPPVALAAAGLVLLSPVFLLYGRTATIVGMSLTPALLAMILLHGALTRPASWRWLAGLNATLLLSGYAYAPIRFLWLIALGLFLVEIGFRRERWRPLAAGFAVTAAVFLSSATLLPRADPVDGWLDAVQLYYNGRGEQVFALNDQPEGYEDFLIQDEADRAANADADAGELATKLVLQNARDLRDLLLDRGTRPAVTDYWNASGRLHPGFLVPMFLFGMVLSLMMVRWSTEQRLLQALLWGFSLPLLLTSRVHIGRLIFIVPIVALLTALPLSGIVRWLTSRQRPADRAAFKRQGAPVVAGVLVLIGGGLGWAEWRTEIPRTGMAAAVEQIAALAAAAPDRQLVYVFGDEGGREIELLNIAELELGLGDRVRFSDSATPDVVHGDEGPLLVYGAMLGKVGRPDLIPGYCETTYLLAPGLEDTFLELTGNTAEVTCGGPLTYELLP